MALRDLFERVLRRGRPPKEPERETLRFPALIGLGQNDPRYARILYKATPKNLRYFSRSPIARKAINVMKNSIAMMDWEIVPKKDIKANSELNRQIKMVTECLEQPNHDDNFLTFQQQIIEDLCLGAAAVEIGRAGNAARPIWLWPVDGLSIQIYPGWAGGRSEARYFQTLGYGGYTVGQSRGIPLRDDELIYLRPNPTTSTPFGFGPLEIAFNSISRQLSTADFAGKVAGNALPPFMLDLGEVDQNALNAFRQYWRSDVEGQGTVPIVATSIAQGQQASKARGANVMRLYPDGDTALYLKYQEFLRTEIAAAFDLSNQSLNLERDVNRNTAEVMEDADWDRAVKPTAQMLKLHYDRDVLFGAFGFSQIEFRWKGIDREDEAATSEILTRYFDRTIFTVNEVRVKLGEEPTKDAWGDMRHADIEIAKNAARSAGVIEDPQLPNQGGKGTQPATPAAPAIPKVGPAQKATPSKQ